MNNIILIGNIGHDLEVRYTQGGTAVTNIRLAVTTRFKDKERTDWFTVVVWGRQAEACHEYLSKGSKVAVEGRVQNDTEERDGKKFFKSEVHANRVEFLDRRKEDSAYRGPETGDSAAESRN